MRFLIQPAVTTANGCLLAAALALSTGCVAKPAPTGPAAQQQQLLLVLEREMNSNTGWVRIHAADALIDHRHTQVVASSFAREADTAAPPCRIGVWRVLARAAATEEQRQAFIERIRRTMLDPPAPDRVHAAESLAKLGAASPSDSPALLEWLTTASEAASVYPLWLLVLSGGTASEACSEARLTGLLDSNDSTARLRAAFALGRINTISTTSLTRLNRRLAVEPVDSPARTYLAAALLRHSASDSAGAAHSKQVIRDCMNRRPPAERLEAATTLGMFGTQADLRALAPLLRSPDADARIGAASGSLYILQSKAPAGSVGH